MILDSSYSSIAECASNRPQNALITSWPLSFALEVLGFRCLVYLRAFRVGLGYYRWLAGNAGMQKKTETTIMGYI